VCSSDLEPVCTTSQGSAAGVTGRVDWSGDGAATPHGQPSSRSRSGPSTQQSLRHVQVRHRTGTLVGAVRTDEPRN